MPGIQPSADFTEELIAFCRRHLAHVKCPRSVNFEEELRRLPTGKLISACCAIGIGARGRAGSCAAEAAVVSGSGCGRRRYQIRSNFPLHRVEVRAEAVDEDDRYDERQSGADQRGIVGSGHVKDEPGEKSAQARSQAEDHEEIAVNLAKGALSEIARDEKGDQVDLGAES